jgi:hypothetical protein
MKHSLKATDGLLQDTLLHRLPRRKRLPAMPPPRPAEENMLREAEYRLGVLNFGGDFVETALFLRADGIELGYYTFYLDPQGCFVDFVSYDAEKEIRAVYESFAGYDDGKSLTEMLEQDLRAMGYRIPSLREQLSDLRLTCESCAMCGCFHCTANCPLQERYRPQKPIDKAP